MPSWITIGVLLKDAPNRDNALKFMNFLLEPENIAAVTNFAQYTAGVKGVSELLTDELKASPEANPPAAAPMLRQVLERLPVKTSLIPGYGVPGDDSGR